MRGSTRFRQALLLGVAAVACGHARAQTAPVAVPIPQAVPIKGLTFNATYDSFDYDASLYVDDGKVVRDKTTPANITGKVDGRGGKGVRIVVNANRTNGVYVKGRTDFTLTNSTIDVRGDSGGWDENFGLGAGATVGEGATMTLRNVTIVTHGIKATPAAAANGVMRIYDSTLIAEGGDVPPENLVPGSGPGYVGPPEALNMRGTARGFNTVGKGKAYIYNSRIVAQGWGAMSTDSATKGLYLEVNDSDIEVRDGGYGTYSDINAEVLIRNSHFHVPDVSGVISGDGKITFENVTEDRANHAAMLHAPGGDFLRAADLTIRGGRFVTRDASVLVMSHNADIVIDGADLRPATGVILKSIVNPSKRAALMQWLLNPKRPDKVVTGPVTGIRTTLANMAIKGDIEHFDTTRRMDLTLKRTRLMGAIRGSVWAIGDVKVSLDPASRWTATDNSYVTLIGATNAAQFDAPGGVAITALAGEGTTLLGRYALPGGGQLLVKKLP